MNAKIAMHELQTICLFHMTEQEKKEILNEDVSIGFKLECPIEERAKLYHEKEYKNYVCDKISTRWANNKLEYFELIFSDPNSDRDEGFESSIEEYDNEERLEDIVSHCEDYMLDN